MCNNENGIRGGSINPRARSSIHDHPNCLFKSPEDILDMGGYGLKNTRSGSSQASQAPTGHDEIDNVQSKHMRPRTSPIAVKRIENKRNSFDENRFLETDDSIDSESSKLHSKSLPANFSQPSSENEFNHNYNYNALYQSEDYQGSNENINISKRLDNLSGSTNEDYENSVHGQRDKENSWYKRTEKKSSIESTVFGLFVVAIALSAMYVGTTFLNNSENTSFHSLQFRFEADLHHIQEKYNVNYDSILRLQTGLSTIIQRHDTGSFIFTYNGHSINFDQNDAESFVENVASIASRYLRNKSVQHVVIDGSNLAMRSHNELMEKYREMVASNGVLLVKNLDRVPSALAMAFHYYCDEYNPLVKTSAILFTLDMTKCSHNSAEQEPTLINIENCLKKKWNGVPEDEIGPLINRVVNTVIDVTG